MMSFYYITQRFYISHMSSGYTRDKASIAPAEPAAACPTGGKVSFVTVAIVI
jgi:hypothetical protein